MRQRLPAVLGLGMCFLTSAVLAEVPVFSAEISLGIPIIGPAVANQQWPGGAFDGTNFLVTWGGIAARFSPAGTLLDPFGFPYSDHDSEVERLEGGAGVASDGTASLVVYQTTTIVGGTRTLRGRRISKAGTLLGASFPIGTPCGINCVQPARVAFDGTNYVVAWVENGARVARVSPAGVLLDATPLNVNSAQDPLVGLTCDGTNCLVTWAPSNGGLRGRFVSKAATLVRRRSASTRPA